LLGLALELRPKSNRTIIERILSKEFKTEDRSKTPKSWNNKSSTNRRPSLSSFGFRQKSRSRLRGRVLNTKWKKWSESL